MKTALATMALLLLTGSANAQLYAKKQTTYDINMDCVPYKHTGKDNQKSDPVYKISVIIKTDDEAKDIKVWVIHHTRSGEQYNRFAQYSNPQFHEGNGPAFTWQGALKTNPLVHMVGKFEYGNQWNYEERQYRGGRNLPVFEMKSVCHPVAE